MTPDLPLFVYGTLRDPDILGAVIGRPAPRSRTGWAVGCRAVYFPGQVYPALVAAPGEVAEGLLLDDLGAGELAALDRFEGELYRRGLVTVECGGTKVEALAYWPTLAVPADAAPWTLDLWLKRHKSVVVLAEIAAGIAARQALAPK
jgi:gamma-glutamylcyclotransferase (GGCT)/AIG2-like uncharacterized protein YtfP